MNNHNEDGEDIGLPLCWNVGRVGDRTSSKDHSTQSIVDRRSTCDLHHPV